MFVLGLYSMYFGLNKVGDYFSLELAVELPLVDAALLLVDRYVAEWFGIAE